VLCEYSKFRIESNS